MMPTELTNLTEPPAPTVDNWAIMPFLNAPDLTEQATLDLLAQTLPTRVLLIDQGCSQPDSDRLRRFADEHHPQVLLWTCSPPLPSLSAVWNRALQFVWELGGSEALVVNNDCRFRSDMYELLKRVCVPPHALFVSAIGVREGQFDPQEPLHMGVEDGGGDVTELSKGGPDFSCFLLSREGHLKYPFDENFIPAYHEDLDMHRRFMLGGDGDRIFSVNLPFLHYASGTIKQYTPEQRAAFNRKFAACKEYYTRKWGGGPNQETFRAPFGEGQYAPWLVAALLNPDLGNELQTTPDLQRYWQVNRRPTDVSA